MDLDAVFGSEWVQSSDDCIRWGGNRRRFGCEFGASAMEVGDADNRLDNRFTALLEFVRDHPGEQVPER